MCIAASGKILSIEGKKAKADIMGNILDINISLVNAKEGDYVLVHAGCAIERVKKEFNEELLQLYKEIEDLENADV